jgi:hypothetical protein
MPPSDGRLWPYTPRAGLGASGVVLVGLLLLIALFRAVAGWPTEHSENAVLIGVFVVSLLPILLALLDVIIERGAVIEAAGVKIDFARSREVGVRGITVAANIGAQGQAVADSDTTQILSALKQATAADVVVIDLEDGEAWWETRLLVLVSGAERLGRPKKIVFLGTEAGKERRFQGWSYASDLLPLLVRANQQYQRSLEAARSAAAQWALVEPINNGAQGAPVQIPLPPPWIAGVLATRHQWMAFDASTGLHNELLPEQLLQSDLGEKIEQQHGSRSINLVRLDELFRPILNREHIELSSTPDRQLDVLLNTEMPSIALTQDRRYVALAPTVRLHGEVLKSLVKASEAKAATS